MIYGLTKGTDFEKLCDGAAKAEAAGVMTYYALARMAKEQGYPEEVSEAAGEEKGEEQVNQFAQAFRSAGMNEAADEMEVFAKQEGHHGATLRAMIEKYRKCDLVT